MQKKNFQERHVFRWPLQWLAMAPITQWEWSLTYGSNGGLPDFVELSLIVMVQGQLAFAVKCLHSWYREFFRIGIHKTCDSLRPTGIYRFLQSCSIHCWAKAICHLIASHSPARLGSKYSIYWHVQNCSWFLNTISVSNDFHISQDHSFISLVVRLMCACVIGAIGVYEMKLKI